MFYQKSEKSSPSAHYSKLWFYSTTQTTEPVSSSHTSEFAGSYQYGAEVLDCQHTLKSAFVASKLKDESYVKDKYVYSY